MNVKSEGFQFIIPVYVPNVIRTFDAVKSSLVAAGSDEWHARSQ